MSIIKARHLGFNYMKYTSEDSEPEKIMAIDEIDLDIEPGEFIAVLGHNGSGKSTLAKHMNALLTPTSGTMWIDGVDTMAEEDLWKVRQKAGMVFQNPDNQIIGTVVEEDVGFGPENLGIPTDDIWKRVEEALTRVGMLAFREKSPNRLSGGQKQRVAIAGVVAMRPQCIVLDEPTAMLDPNGRMEVLKVVRELNEKENVTVILITHYMEEVVWADRVYVMDKGDIVMQGTPREIFSQVDTLKHYHLDVPEMTDLAHELKKAGIDLPDGILTREELIAALGPGPGTDGDKAEPDGRLLGADEAASHKKDGEVLLEVKDVSYTYSVGTVYEVAALEHIDLTVREGEFIGVIGHTGSGKSTFVQHLNGLIRPTSGHILWRGQDIYGSGFELKSLRTQVGLVFQYPEHQLFETDIITDVCFGPRNQGLTKEEAVQAAKDALRLVGIPEELEKASPFEISGGQKRRVAIAGVLAMQPRVLILDEPTAGLDPQGRDELLDLLKSLQRERGITIMLVTHSMEDAARYADRLLVLSEGRLQFDDTPRRVFRHYKELEPMGLMAPQVTYFMHDLIKAGWPVDADAMTVDEARDEIIKCVNKEGASRKGLS